MAQKIQSPTGDSYVIVRDWLPWERKFKDVDSSGFGADVGGLPDFPDFDFPDLGDDPISAIIGIVFLVVFILFFIFWLIIAVPFLIGLAFIVGELLILLALLPIIIPLRSLFFKWNIRVLKNGKLFHEEKIKGWFASRKYMAAVKEQVVAGVYSR